MNQDSYTKPLWSITFRNEETGLQVNFKVPAESKREAYNSVIRLFPEMENINWFLQGNEPY